MKTIALVAAVLCFLLAAFKADPTFPFLAVGLALGFGSFLLPDRI